MFVGLHLLKTLRHQHPFAKYTNIYEHAALDVVILGVSLHLMIFSFQNTAQTLGTQTSVLREQKQHWHTSYCVNTWADVEVKK
jgi:hypothetical protein